MSVNPRYPIAVDGCDYSVEVMHARDSHGMRADSADVIWIYDAEGKRVADAEWDGACEALCGSYYGEDGLITEQPVYQTDLYPKNWREVAAWLVATHPVN